MAFLCRYGVQAWLHLERRLDWGRDFFDTPVTRQPYRTATLIDADLRLNCTEIYRPKHANDALALFSRRCSHSSRPHRLHTRQDLLPRSLMPPKSATAAKGKKNPQTEEREESLQAVVSA